MIRFLAIFLLLPALLHAQVLQGDARKLTADVSGTTVTCAAANFTAGDIGKTIWAIETGSGLARLPRTTITNVLSGTQATTALPATSSYTNLTLIYGSDDTAALQALTSAARTQQPRGVVTIPAGGYVFSALPFDCAESSVHAGLGVIGAGSGRSVFYPAPDYDWNSTAANEGLFWKTNANTRDALLQGVSVDGCSMSLPGSGYHVISDAGDGTTMRDVHVKQVRGITSHVHLVSTRFRGVRLWSEGSSYIGLSCSGGSYLFQDCYTGNHAYYGLHVTAINGASNTGVCFRWNNGIVDECGSIACEVNGSSDVVFAGARMFGGVNGWACEVTGGSDVRFIGCELLGYGGQGPNRGGLSVGTGCVAKLTACVLDGFNGGEALSNAGLVLDGLNNTFSSRSGNAPLTILNVATLPSADPGVSGAVWNNNGVLNISP